jgi:prepilin-type N-terminal cleavage/methylation domain-containing protein
MKNLQKRQSGFTILELVVVIVAIIILVTIIYLMNVG